MVETNGTIVCALAQTVKLLVLIVISKTVPGVDLPVIVAKIVRKQTGITTKHCVTKHGPLLLMGMHWICFAV
jgi:hypothetical protein